MITREEIQQKRSYFLMKQTETNGAKWVQKELDIWDKVELTLEELEQQQAENYFMSLDLKRAIETLSYIEKVFESLGFLGEHAFLFSRNPKPIDGFYTLALLQLMPNEEPFKKTLLSYFHGISNERIQRASEAYLQRERERLNTTKK